MDYEVRDARASDFAAVADLMVRVYVGEGFSPPESSASLRRVPEHAATADLIVAADSRSLFGAAFLVLDGPLRQIANADEAEVRTLCVEPGLRRNGVAEKLMRACLHRTAAAGRAGVVLSTQPTMVAAHRLYEKLGFSRAPARDWRRRSGREMLAYTLRLDQRPASCNQQGPPATRGA